MILFDLLNDKNKMLAYAEEIGKEETPVSNLTNAVIRDLYSFRTDTIAQPANTNADRRTPAYWTDIFRTDILSARSFQHSAATMLGETAGRMIRNNMDLYYVRTMSAFLELQNWKKYQRIYAIDNDFFQDFVKTEEIVIDFSSMSRLPFSSFYIDLSSVYLLSTNHYTKVAGVLVNVLDTETIHLVVIDTENTQYNIFEAYQNYPMFPANWKSFYTGKGRFVDVMLSRADATEKLKTDTSFTECLGWNAKANNVVEYVDMNSQVMKDICMFTIQFLYFLHTKTNDIVLDDKESKKLQEVYKERKGEVRQDQTKIRKWDVGFRYGEKIRMIDKKQKIYGDIVGGYTRTRPRPHVRRAHWHGYWFGSGENRHFERIWIEPVFCNGTASDIVANINVVTNAETAGSSGEEMVKQYLDKVHLSYEREYTVTIKNHHRRFDFLVSKDGKKYLIEYDGEQHFRPVEQFGGEEEFRERRLADWDKNKYAKQNKTPLLRIRYDQNELIPELIDAFFEKPSIHRYNPMIPNENYYK